MREAQQGVKERVQAVLYWTEQQYCDFQFEAYCGFVESVAEGWPKVRAQLLYSPYFRGFWNNEWVNRDEHNFLAFAEECSDYSHNLSEYQLINAPNTLLEDDGFMMRYNQVLEIIRYA